MEVPSMVQRSGDKLIVRSVVSGNQLFLDQTANHNRAISTSASASSTDNGNLLLQQQQQQQLERLHAQQQAAIFQQSQQLELQRQAASMSAVEQLNQQSQDAKEEGLPQCKIKRNYSCNYCNYFTQNPRSHLMHLRDVHGERIVINKCQRCLYASRHYQKLVRHMKMVHGCTDHVGSPNGHSRGKRGMNRDVRRRRIDESTGAGAAVTLNNFEEMKQAQQQLLQQQTQQLLTNNSVELFKAFERFQRENQARATWHQPTTSNSSAAVVEQPNKPSSSSADNCIESNRATPTQTAADQEEDANNSDLELSVEESNNKSLNMGALATAANTAINFGDEQQLQNRLLKCSVCDFTTPYRELLIEHEAQDHNKTKFFRCDKCSYVTHIRARYSKHVKYHSMPMIKCCACDFRTPYKWNLDRHMKNHGGAGPFKCAACDFTADIKQSLTVHEMNHHVPPVGHATGMALTRRRNKVGGTDCDDILSDSTDLTEDHFNNNNNNVDDFDEAMLLSGGSDVLAYRKRRYANDEEEPTDLSQKGGGSSDSCSVHNAASPSQSKRPSPNLIPENAINLSDTQHSLNDIAYKFVNDFLSPIDKVNAAQLSPTATIVSSAASQHSRGGGGGTLAKKSSLFDKMKSSNANANLVCACGYIAKFLSESIMHRNSCKLAAASTADDYASDEEPDDADDRLEIDCAAADDDDKQSHSALNLSVSSSLRCQYCRHRCKSSLDLFNHIKHCSEAAHESYDSLSCESNLERTSLLNEHSRHIMDNMWPKGGNGKQSDGSEHSVGELQQLNDSSSNTMKSGAILLNHNEENSYYGVETAPGYGEVTKKMTAEEEAANSSLKKVYKCPHCSFWASTASRFHVHIVGHLNKKPFECSLCSYRSNWRWDITKHIRLKTIRDPSHKTARVLMNDETGRRNYTKYNKYITLMKVTEEDGDPKLMKSGEMTPHQVASLSFINDVNKHVAGGSNAGLITGVQHLNGIKDDITLEPIIPNKQQLLKLDATQTKDDFIHLPWLATMVNAAMAQQQFKDQEQPATLITPSVTISAVKRSPGSKSKPDALESDAIKSAFGCRQCNLSFQNQNEMLEHMKTHVESNNFPIITATPTTGKNAAASSTNNNMQQQQLFMDLNPALLMNNMLAALLQPPNGNQQMLQELSAKLLQQALQANNTPYGSLALANLLVQKNSNNNNNNSSSVGNSNKSNLGAAATAANILEHGEQKAINNEASAQQQTVQQQQQFNKTTTSLQHLLTTTRGDAASAGVGGVRHYHNNNININNNNNNNNNTVMGHNNTQFNSIHANAADLLSNLLGNGAINSSSISLHKTTTTATATNATTNATATTNTADKLSNDITTLDMGLNGFMNAINALPIATTTTKSCNGDASLITLSSPSLLSPCDSSLSTTTATTATTLPTSLSSTSTAATSASASKMTATSAAINLPPLSIETNVGVCCNNGVLVFGEANNSTSTSSSTSTTSNLANNSKSNNNSNSNTVQISSSKKNATAALSLISLAAAPAVKYKDAANASSFHCNSSNTSLLSQCQSQTQNQNQNQNHVNQNNTSLLSNDNGDKREPSPFRCGHCQQASNWKHVIQRHCRLKHNGDVQIEAYDRINDKNGVPIYRLITHNNNNNISSHDLLQSSYNLKTHNMQQQQQQTQLHSLQQQQKQLFNHNNSSNNNNNALLLNKNEHLLQQTQGSNSSSSSVARKINAQKNLQVAAAAFISAINAAANNSQQLNAEEQMLQQQLQQNDQIEITRVPINQSAAVSNLAHLLEQSNASAAAAQQHSKSKHQKCPHCPYICESKSQMNYHVSLHKPTQYECNMCTYVCGKKQHLSSHIRNTHQQQIHDVANNTGTATGNNGVLNLDASAILQLAAQAQKQHDNATLAIDLRSLKSPAAATADDVQTPTQQLPPEYKYKMISYCPKCPARFALKHNESNSTKADLLQHLKCHASGDKRGYCCEFCDFCAAHDAQLQTHLYMHTQFYQSKCNEMFKNCKEDMDYAAPKLQQIKVATAGDADAEQSNELVWVVQPTAAKPQFASISSSSPNAAGNFDNANSLLKKQLEAGPAPLHSNVSASSPKTPTNEEHNEEDSSSNMPSTSASVATSDLAGSESATHSYAASPAPIERCTHCPYESSDNQQYKAHLQRHLCVGQQKSEHCCEHCDYSIDSEMLLQEHTRLHFGLSDKMKSVAFFTSYDKLELTVEQEQEQTAEAANEEASATTAADNELINVKDEQLHNNNNNEENAVNENMVQEQQRKKTRAASEKPEDALKRSRSDISLKRCTSVTKITFQKCEGRVSIKKEAFNSSAVGICTRLRGRAQKQELQLSNGQHVDEESNEATEQKAEQLIDAMEQSVLVHHNTGQLLEQQ